MLRTIVLLCCGILAHAAQHSSQNTWPLAELRKTPQTWDAPNPEEGVKAVWIAGPLYKGKPTRAFAYYGIPPDKKNSPGMVLIHGGGGTAFAEWVRMWNKRGFAAIAVDTVGTIPDKADAAHLWNPTRKRHEFSGPAGWGDFNNIDAPVTDQWSYHAVAVSILAHSFLRAQPGVDPARIGVTGISWGGYLTSIVASLDPRFQFGIPVYGCGFLGEDSAWLQDFAKLGPARAEKWLKLWDPSSYLGMGRRPMFWIDGTNDFAYVMPSWQKSYRLPHGPRTLCLKIRMKHSHPDGATPEEIFAYAESKLMGKAPLVKLRKQGVSDNEVWAVTAGGTQPVNAEFCFTRDTGKWQDRKWESVPAAIEIKSGRVSATIPEGIHVGYLNLVDDRGLVVSTEHFVR